MAAWRSAIRSRLALTRHESGFTLVELLVASAAGIILLSGVVMVMATTLRSQPRVTEKTSQIETGRTTLEALVRELRQASSAPVATTSGLSIITYVPTTCAGAASSVATQCRVNYACAANACTRTLRTTANTGSAPARTIITGLSSNDVFTYSPSAAAPTFIGAQLAFPKDEGGESVTLSDGSALRNAGL